MVLWVGGEQVKDAPPLSFLLSLWPFSGITHFRKETLLLHKPTEPAYLLKLPADPLYTCT